MVSTHVGHILSHAVLTFFVFSRASRYFIDRWTNDAWVNEFAFDASEDVFANLVWVHLTRSRFASKSLNLSLTTG